MKQVQDKDPGGGTYRKRFGREWERATEKLKRSGADLGKIGFSGVQGNYTKYTRRSTGRRVGK